LENACFYVLQGEVDLGANKNIHAVGQGMDHVANTWSTRGGHVYVISFTYNHGGAA